MKCIYSLLFLLAPLFLHAQTTDVKYLSGQGSDDAVEWDFFCTKGRNSGKWDKIKVPSCWEMQGYGTFNYGHDKPKADEEGLYKTSFDIPSDWKNKRIFLVFEGTMTDTEVKVNGKQAGNIHQGAFYRFKREITQLVQRGKSNLLEVKVSKMSANNSINEAERQCDFWVFGGIFRPVYLEAVPEHFIEYTAIDARCQGELNADIFLDKALTGVTAEIEVQNKAGQTMGKITSPLTNAKTNKLSVAGKIDRVLPWSTEDPQLYTALITIRQKDKVLHTLTDRIGFRTVEVKEKDGVYINGVKMRFKGVNRHSHWPATGRTTNKQLSIADVKLMKEMNMNAVRMSHYPPDRHFLEVCDSLGLYVIDELCAWQYPPYDTPVGSILVREMLTRDINRPSIIFWANGNEGGFNFDLDPLFPLYDIQKRAVLHPWGKSGGINTVHYITYNSGIGNMFNGRDIFMPTEILHGLYDGGHGSGLDDYWNAMLSNPLAAGMFLWDFADQAVVRDDRNGFLDTDKDHGADGIVGPYREKEASFFTIKEIWSPIHLQKKYITPGWDGKFTLENRYAFTNANACTYRYQLAKVNSLSAAGMQTLSGTIDAPDIRPGEQGTLQLRLPAGWQEYDLLYVTVTDRDRQELFTYSFETGTPDRVARRLLPESGTGNTDCTATEEAAEWLFTAADVEVHFDKQTGLIRSIVSGGKNIPLTNGPLLITGQDIACKSVEQKTTGGIPQLHVVYTTNNGKNTVYSFTWSLQPSGTLELDYNYRPQDNVKMAGITFDFPETGIQGADLLANGPYRVYKNRMKGGTLNLWEKTYNNTSTGESWDYPEFKGYYALFYGMKLNGPTPFTVYNGKEDVTLHLFTPAIQTLYDPKRNYTFPEYPAGNISFMNEIPAVGTKFGKAENFGPQSQPGRYKGNGPENNVYGKLYFRFSCAQKENTFEKYVNPLIGTDIRIVQGKDKNSTEERGQIMPAVGVPHGMTSWVAQTQATEQKCYPPYYYFQDAIQGFRASHWMNGSCTQDYGSVTIMPLSKRLELAPEKRASSFEHTGETASPSYYSVLLKDYGIQAELTGLSRAGMMRFDFQQEGEQYLVIEPNSDEGVATIQVDPEKGEITGSNPVHRIYQGRGKEAGFSGHFVVRLNEEIANYGIDTTATNHVIAWVKLKSTRPGKAVVKVGTSFTDIEHARQNLEAEIGDRDFDQVRRTSSDTWNKALGQIAIKGNKEEEKVKFYSALYNTHFLPRTFSDTDGSYPEFDGGKQIRKMESGTYYCDFSQWDTYRAVHPLFSILNPARNGDMAHSLVLKGQQGGWLPIFPSWNSYTAAMIGDHCIAMIGDAIMKDAPGFDYEEAYTLMRKNAFEPNTDPASYNDGKGRRAMESYLKYGYVPLEDSVMEAFHRREQVSRTLEYAYDDFVLSQVAKKLGKTDDYNALIGRARNYKNVIDPQTGYARGRHADGSWAEPFDPYAFVSFITEGTPYHYTWYVPQDVAGLIEQIGGKERFTERLDTFFEGDYYWHGNEPGHHIAYLFAYAGQPWKTQKWVHDIIDREYFTTPDGLSGNDDAGQMSAWLVFSMVGFYPVCPGMPYYVIGSPSFEESVITLENGKKFVIEAKGASDKNIYIQSATLNGQPYDKSYIMHKDIMQGGTLRFIMGNAPNKEWASSAASVPPSLEI